MLIIESSGDESIEAGDVDCVRVLHRDDFLRELMSERKKRRERRKFGGFLEAERRAEYCNQFK